MTEAARTEELERLMDAYGTDIKRFCTLQLMDRHKAEDAAQDVFLKAWRALDSFRGDSEMKTWLMRIAVNTCRDLQRTGWYRFVDRRLTPDDLPERGEEDAVPDGEVSRAIGNLPKKLRMTVLLRYYRQMTVREVASALSISPATAKRRLSKANELLRQTLERWYYDE